MLVKELKPGKLIALDDDMICYMQESHRSKIPRLRIANSIIGRFISADKLKNKTMIYLGESSEFLHKKHKGRYCKQRLVMVEGCMAFIDGSEFKNFSVVSS